MNCYFTFRIECTLARGQLRSDVVALHDICSNRQELDMWERTSCWGSLGRRWKLTCMYKSELIPHASIIKQRVG